MTKIVVGVTGGIGCGMSEVAKRLKILGATVINMDRIGRKVVEEDSSVRAQLKQIFGEQYFEADGSLNRKKLGTLVFSDQKARQALEEIVHPKMIARTKAEIDKKIKVGKHSLIVVDAALIYELGLDDEMEYTVVVKAPLELRINRVRQRDGLSDREINDRISAQIPLKKKLAEADYVISNGKSLIDLDKEVQSLYRWLKLRIKEKKIKDK